MGKSILIVNTSADKLGGHPTGLWLEETATPYYILKDAGFDVVMSSIKGGPVPVDAGSITGDFFTENSKKFLHDPTAMGALWHSVPLADVEKDVTEKFAAVYISGGHGCAVDCHDNPMLKSVIERMYAEKLVFTNCHGPMSLAQCNKPSGEPLVKGLKVCGFSDSEEKAVQLQDAVPFMIESKFREQGADFQLAPDWNSIAVQDGNLITGQNPQSSEAVAKLAVEALAKM